MLKKQIWNFWVKKITIHPKCLKNSVLTIRYAYLQEKKVFCKKQSFKTRVKLSMYLLGAATRAAASTILGVLPYSKACLRKVEREKTMKLLDSISELISNTDMPKIQKYIGCVGAEGGGVCVW